MLCIVVERLALVALRLICEPIVRIIHLRTFQADSSVDIYNNGLNLLGGVLTHDALALCLWHCRGVNIFSLTLALEAVESSSHLRAFQTVVWISGIMAWA